MRAGLRFTLAIEAAARHRRYCNRGRLSVRYRTYASIGRHTGKSGVQVPLGPKIGLIAAKCMAALAGGALAR